MRRRPAIKNDEERDALRALTDLLTELNDLESKHEGVAPTPVGKESFSNFMVTQVPGGGPIP
jgi:uncharacterized protein with von Willebrand factor type A (vWA) domain